VTPGQSFSGQTVTLPPQAPAMIRRIGPVSAAAAIGDVGPGVNVYRNDRISAANTNAISVYAAQTSLLATLQGTVSDGRFLNGATARFPAVVLGTGAAQALGVDRADGSVQVWLGNHWFSVVGILAPMRLAPELDRSALVGFPAAEQLLGADGSAVEIYVRADPVSVTVVQSVLAATADPAAPQNVAITNPADALIARADAAAAFQSLFLALGVVALLVGGIGIANVMVIAVLERRGEIGLRRALGARRRHIRAQFLAEALVLTLAGGAIGITLAYVLGAAVGSLPLLGPLYEDTSGTGDIHLGISPGTFAVSMVILVAVGVLSGLVPALRASHLDPVEALRYE